MIQPIQSAKSTWTLFWIDLEEPVLGEDGGVILPTIVMLTDANGIPLERPELMEELDQIRVENYLGAVVEKLGAPERILVAEDAGWDAEAWQAFAEDFGVKVELTKIADSDRQAMVKVTQKLVRHPGEVGAPESDEILQGLLKSALRVRSESKKSALLKKVLEYDPACGLARVELADVEFRRGDFKTALKEYDAVAEKEEQRWAGSHPDWWVHHETRPLLRAIYGRAMTLWHEGRHLGAAENLSALLARNPADHQGVRFLVPLLFMLGEDFDAAQEAFEDYDRSYPQDYPEPSLTFGWGVLHAHFGRDAEAREKFNMAILRNLYIAPILLDVRPPVEMMWHPNDRAEPGYAREFQSSYSVLWERVPSALRALREAWDESATTVERIAAHREKMFDFQDQRYDPGYKKVWAALVAEDESLSAPQAPGA